MYIYTLPIYSFCKREGRGRGGLVLAFLFLPIASTFSVSFCRIEFAAFFFFFLESSYKNLVEFDPGDRLCTVSEVNVEPRSGFNVDSPPPPPNTVPHEPTSGAQHHGATR